MTAWLRRHRQALMIGTLVVMIIGIFVGLGSYYFIGADNSEAVASVGSAKIPYSRFQSRVDQYLEALRENSKDKELGADMVKEVKRSMLRDMVVEELLTQQAEKLGLRVTDMEVAFNIRNTPRFQRDGQFDQSLYFQAVRYGLRTTPEDYEVQQRKAMLSAKLKNLIFNAAKLTPQEIEAAYAGQDKKSKEYEKDKDKFAQNLQQARAMNLINFYLRQVSTQVNVQFFLDQREQGV